jgi:hypothetical protein
LGSGSGLWALGSGLSALGKIIEIPVARLGTE